jgi:uncharacterized repeat protein (TIGR03803 family)
MAGLVADPSGTYYGTTSHGGSEGNGAVFSAKLVGSKWVVKAIHTFCRHLECTDGSTPQGPLVVDTAGNLYGMATSYGKTNSGMIYEVSPNGGRWTFKVLHNFCAKPNCPDGGAPSFGGLSYKGAATGVPYDGTSPLFGTVPSGGVPSAGVVFALTPNGARWTYKVIYSFCSQMNCTDGGVPQTGVTIDAAGNIFGTNSLGGVSATSDQCCGVLYEMKPQGKGWTFSVLHSFCSTLSGDLCADGRKPLAVPTLDAAGNVFGTTFQGGANDLGTAYEFAPGSGKFTVLHNFCSQTDCADGATPYVGSLVLGASGELYGTAAQGGAGGGGVVFKLSGKHFTALGLFANSNGALPLSTLALEPSGALLGTTQYGGIYSNGVLYEITP